MTGKYRGFTLIEMMIALFLVTVTFAALVAVYPMVYRHATMSKNRFLAAQVAENIIESLHAVPWGKPVTPFILSDQTFTQVIEGQRHPVTFKVKKINFDPSNSSGNGPDPKKYLSQVTVTIEWMEGTKASGQMRRQTFTANGALSKN